MGRQFKPGQLQTGSLFNISSSYALTASFALNGGGTTIDTGSFATTGSNTFRGDQTISGSIYLPDNGYSIYFSGSSAASRLTWNSTDGTLDLGMGLSNATQQIGQELYNPPIVNKSGGDLVDGDLVMVDPTGIAQGNRVAVVKCIANGTYPADYIVGVLTADVANNQTGLATWFGYVRNINKNHLYPTGETWIEGDVLYPHPTEPGKMTHTQPTAPNLKSTIAVVTSINGNNVTLMVRPSLRGQLDSLHNVTITSSAYGDLLMRSGSVWINTKQLSGSYDLTGSLNVTGNITATTFIGSLSGTASYASTTAILATGSVSASVNIVNDIFIIKSGSTVPFSINASGQVTISGSGTNLFLIKNTNNQPVLTVSQSGVIILATQSVELTSPAPAGGIYFTSGSFYVGLI